MVSIVQNDLQVTAIIISRSTASVEVREQLASQDWASILASSPLGMHEWALLTTCHRFELYFAAPRSESSTVTAALCDKLLSFVTTPDDEMLAGHEPWVILHDDEAARHLSRVAAGLDSLVLGEAQIQGQVISAYTDAVKARTVGPLLSSLFRTAIRVGKRARTETQISTRAVSMSSVALSMAARYFPDFTQANVLVIGAGEMSRLALKALLQRNVTHVTVANRTLSRAETLLMHPMWQAVGLDEARASMGSYDVIFSATSAQSFVVTREQFSLVQARNGDGHTQVFIDLAVPRDIDPAIRDLPNVVLVDVDDLRQGLDQSLEYRQQALPQVYAIIDEEMIRWEKHQRELSMRPVVVELRQRAERIRQQEVERTMRFIGEVDDETKQHIHHLSRALVNKLLHEPTIRIKELAHTLADNEDADTYMSAICDLFGLEAGQPAHAPNHPLDTASDDVPNEVVEEHAKLSGEPGRG